MDYYPDGRQAGKDDDEENSGQEEKRGPVQDHDQLRTDQETRGEDQEGDTKKKPATSKTTSKSPKKKRVPKVSLFYKILAVVAIYLSFTYIWSFMKEPVVPFYHKLIVIGICAVINFVAVWALFSRLSLVRFYLSLFAILGSVGYYFYVNYTNHSFLGHNLITSVLMIIFVLMVINPNANYYLKSILLLLIPIIGIYLSPNKFALVWTLMWSAGLILLFRVSNLQPKSKEKRDNKNVRGRKNKNESV